MCTFVSVGGTKDKNNISVADQSRSLPLAAVGRAAAKISEEGTKRTNERKKTGERKENTREAESLRVPGVVLYIQRVKL